jgi:hypothetical protein
MKESMALLIKAVDGFGFLSEDFGMDLVSYEYNRMRTGYFKAIFENRDVRVSLTLEKNQLFIHFASALYPDEWHSMLRLVRFIARRGGKLTHDEQDTDYWRHGMKLESQFEIAAKQLERTIPTIMTMFTGSDLEPTRAELNSHRVTAPEAVE